MLTMALAYIYLSQRHPSSKDFRLSEWVILDINAAISAAPSRKALNPAGYSYYAYNVAANCRDFPQSPGAATGPPDLDRGRELLEGLNASGIIVMPGPYQNGTD